MSSEIGMGGDLLSFYSAIAPAIPAHSTAVEVGVWLGRSLIHLGKELAAHRIPVQLYGVDTFDGGPAATPAMKDFVALYDGSLYDECERRLRMANVEARLIRATSVEAARGFEDGECSFVFIDASHTYEGTKADIEAWLPKVRAGGVLAGHDFKDYEDVARAVKELLPSVYLTCDGCWRMDKP
jgi:hypothetical protein